MVTAVLTTKLYIPPVRPTIVRRPRLVEQLNEGLRDMPGITLVSAPAGFGKTTLVSEWLANCKRPAAWLSLDDGDNDLARFLIYLIAALQTLDLPREHRDDVRQVEGGDTATIGEEVLGMLHASQPQFPPVEVMLTALLNEISTSIPDHFLLILDDYHVIDAKPVEQALAFLLEHLPPQMHLVIATREDPQLPLARLRAQGRLNELRVADLRFLPSEAAEFLNQVMGLNLSTEDITALESRTEGWIAGLQLAALSMQGQQDTASFIQSFTGSHRFVMDYLLEEVLHQQPAGIQTFLLHTSILHRLCGPLCEAILRDPSVSAQETLEHLERANLFIVPLDNERRWYRYHHLFADLLRQRLHQSFVSVGGTESSLNELHMRASQWYEDNGLDIEAFQHAAEANDIKNAARLMEGDGMPLLFRGAVAPVRKWLQSLPATVLDANPSLWVMYASALLFVNQIAGVEEKLKAAEAALTSALRGAAMDDKTRDLVGHIASIRATVAVVQHQTETILAQSRRALKYLHPDNLPVRTATTWTLGYAYQLQGDRTAAGQAYTEAIAISQTIGHFIITFMATMGLGNVQELENQLHVAAETYQRVLQLAGDPPMPAACEAHLGLARISYEWNDLPAAERHGRISAQLARQVENTDNFIACEVFLARLKLARDDRLGAAAILDKAGQSVRQHNFVHRMPEVAAAQVLTLLRQGNMAAAAHLVQTHHLPLSQARVDLARGDTSAALAGLEPWRRQAEEKGWADERLKVMILQTLVYRAHGEKDRSLQLLGEALALAEPEGFIRIFVDEGLPMARLLSEATARRMMPDYVATLLAAFETEPRNIENKSSISAQPLIEPLSQRELEILQLIAQGLSNREISERLYLALDTVKGHNRNIFDKMQVQRRTEAVARARDLGLV